MKNKRKCPSFPSFANFSMCLTAGFVLAAGTQNSSAANMWWDGSASNANSASDNATTTAQNWLSGGNWDNGATSAPLASWTSGDSAVFGGSAASQTITAGSITVGNLTFGEGAQGLGTSGTAYTVSGGTVTLSGSTITSNTPTTINSVLAGSTGLTSVGSSTLTLGGNNTYTGATVVNSGTLKVTPAGFTPYRYYRFTVSANNGNVAYNQIGELHYYNAGVWTAATTGSAAPTNGASGTEQFWGNVNDNKGANVSGFTKFGINTVPYSLTYDFNTPRVFTSYNWSTANDSTPARNPRRWIVAGSNDNNTWVPLDDRSATDQAGPTNTFTWSGGTGTYTTVTNAANDGAANAYQIAGAGNIPITSDVRIASGATLDLNGCNQVIASLANSGPGGGSIVNSSATKPLTLSINPASGSTTFSGVISDTSSVTAVSVMKSGAGTQIFDGINTYRGTTTVNGGTLQLGTSGNLGSGVLSVISGTFDLNGRSQTVSNFGGTGGALTNSSSTTSTLTVNIPAGSGGNLGAQITTPSAGNIDIIVNPTSGGAASNTALANAANTFRGSITVNGTGSLTGNDSFGVLGINTDGALGDSNNDIVLNNGGAICNMFNPTAAGGWPGHAVFTLGASRTITLTGIGGVLRVGYGEACGVNGEITGEGSLAKTDGGAITLGGSISNTYTGTTILGGTGKLVLAKTGGATAIPGNIELSSTAWNGQNSGIVLAADEQIADSAILTWTGFALGGGGQQDSFFRPNGRTETIAGLVSQNNGGKAVIENRGSGDSTSYGTGTVILNVTDANLYSYNGSIRDMDGGTGGGNIALVKTGTGTQFMLGTLAHSGSTTVNDGELRINGSVANSSVTVTGTGTLTGTGTFGSPMLVNSGGILSPGPGGTMTSTSTVTIGAGGTLVGSDTLNGTIIIASGGLANGNGTFGGSLTVQSGGTLDPAATAIGNMTVNGTASLAGDAKFTIDKTSGFLTCDTVTGFSNITYGGTLTIEATGDAPELGDSYQLFVPGAGGTFSGSFTSIVGLPALPGGLQWETTSLLTTGRINVVNYVSTPSFDPAAGGYIGAQSVTISSDSGSTIYYTIDGSAPTTSSPSGASPITGITIPTDSVITLRAFASKSGQTDSPEATAVYHTVTTATWNVDADGNWSDTLNWLNEVSPNAIDAPVNFTFPRSAFSLVTLDGNRTAGHLTFGNTNGFEWYLSTSNGSVLTLATTSGTPTITTQDVTTTITPVIAGTQGIVKNGPGTLTLTAANSYAGNTAINGGVLSISSLTGNGNNSGIGKGSTLSFDSGTLRYTGGSVGAANFNRDITLNAGGGTLDAAMTGFWFSSGVISGSGPLTKTGTGQLITSGSNTFDGNFNINEAEVQIRNVNSLGSTVGSTTVANGARLCAGGGLTGTIAENLTLTGEGGGNGALQSNDGGTTVTFSGNVTLAADAALGGSNNFTISGPIGGPGGLVKLAGTAVTLSGASSNTYAGTTTLGSFGKLILAKTGGATAIPGNINISSTAWNGNNAGIVLGGDEQIANSSIITWTTTSYGGGGQAISFLRLNGRTETIGGLVSFGAPGGAVIENRGYTDTAAYGDGTLIVSVAGATTASFNGDIRDVDGGTGGGKINMVISGSGTQILSGGLSYSGTTTVNGGNLQLDSTTAVSPVSVVSGGTLKGGGTTSGTISITAGGNVAPGASIGTLTTGSATIAGTYQYEVDGSIGDRLTVNGALNLTGSTLAINELSPILEPSYVIASYTTTLTGTFGTVTGMPAGVSLVYDTANKQILLVKAAGYDTWAGDKGLTEGVNDGLTDDPDNDGVENLLEFYLNGNPLVSDPSGLPAQALDATYLTLTFSRRDDAEADVATQEVQYGSTLSGWTGVTIGAVSSGPDGNGVIVTVSENSDAPDTITVQIPRALAPGGKLFGRLKVTK